MVVRDDDVPCGVAEMERLLSVAEELEAVVSANLPRQSILPQDILGNGSQLLVPNLSARRHPSYRPGQALELGWIDVVDPADDHPNELLAKIGTFLECRAGELESHLDWLTQS